MNKFEEIEAFVAVVDQRSFSAASERSGVAKSVLSRRVSDLEKRLGVQLMQRTTRRLSLTDAGAHFYQRAVQLLVDLSEAEQMVSDSHCQLSGRIKISTPLGLGSGLLALPLAEFMSKHEELEIVVELNDRLVDMVEEGFDLAIRIGELQDSSLIARKLADVSFAVCASPGYLKKVGYPDNPADLSGQQVMIYSNALPSRQWRFSKDGEQISPRVKSRVSANNGDFLASMAGHGLGFTSAPLFFLQKYIDNGELLPVLGDWVVPNVGMYAVYPPGKLVSRRVKMLSDYLAETFRDKVI